MDHLEHCDLLEGEVERFAALVETAPLSMSVPSCPEWTVGDLALHLGTVHRWAEHLVRVRAPRRIPSSEMGLDSGPVDGEWVRRGGTALLRTLRAADPAASMWAWGSDQHVRFWSRRQLHETLVHRFDLELAGGGSPAAPAHLAADTIDEFLGNLATAEYFSPKVARLRGNGERILFRTTDTAHSWTVGLHPDRFDVGIGERSATATLSGSAATLSLVLYRRLALAASGLDVAGRRDLVDFWIANSALE
ncbi:MAG: maleylpyruvate isomerase family mycothiol-dependent enzyme [Acidimicrobiales bacterium]|jgi:uncharacterized protein (TIGR03083 family)